MQVACEPPNAELPLVGAGAFARVMAEFQAAVMALGFPGGVARACMPLLLALQACLDSLMMHHTPSRKASFTGALWGLQLAPSQVSWVLTPEVMHANMLLSLPGFLGLITPGVMHTLQWARRPWRACCCR